MQSGAVEEAVLKSLNYRMLSLLSLGKQGDHLINEAANYSAPVLFCQLVFVFLVKLQICLVICTTKGILSAGIRESRQVVHYYFSYLPVL